MKVRSVGACALALVCPVLSPSTALADMADLTTAGASHLFANGGLFQQFDVKATGTGVFDSFLRIGDSGATTSGYNTDGTVEFDTKDDTHTHSIRLNDIPTVVINGITYREFLLDSNEPGAVNKQDISLDEFKIFLGAVGNLTGYPGSFGSAIYDLDSDADNYVKVRSSLSTGSGSSDIRALIESSLFTGSNPYVYVYAKFGLNEEAQAGFEEFGVRKGTAPVVPAPGALLLAAVGLGIVGRARRFLA